MLITHLDCLNLAHWIHNTASEDGLGPICFAIVDIQGELIWFERMDRAPARSVATATAKAYTAARVEISTLSFKNQLEKDNLQSQDYMDNKLTAIPGGAPLMLANGHIVGAIGISGRHTESDQALADAAAQYFGSL